MLLFPPLPLAWTGSFPAFLALLLQNHQRFQMVVLSLDRWCHAAKAHRGRRHASGGGGGAVRGRRRPRRDRPLHRACRRACSAARAPLWPELPTCCCPSWLFLPAVVDALACSWRGLRVLCADARRLQVPVASNAFPSYYGGSSSHPKVFMRYPTSQASGVQSLAAAGQQGVQSLYSGCGDSV